MNQTVSNVPNPHNQPLPITLEEWKDLHQLILDTRVAQKQWGIDSLPFEALTKLYYGTKLNFTHWKRDSLYYPT